MTVRLQHNIFLSEEEDSKYLRWIAVNIFTKGFSLFGTLRSLPWRCWCELGTCAISIWNSKHIGIWLMVYTFPPTYPLLPSKWWKSQQEGPAWPRRPWLGPVSSWNMFLIKFTSNTLHSIWEGVMAWKSQWSLPELFVGCCSRWCDWGAGDLSSVPSQRSRCRRSYRLDPVIEKYKLPPIRFFDKNCPLKRVNQKFAIFRQNVRKLELFW